MFYYLNGELTYRDLNTCVIDCMGVGYKLTVSQITSGSLASALGKRVKLFTYLAVREDGIELFGIGSDEERASFIRLITVSGVGPKAAMSILSIMTPADLAVAICTENSKAIAKASGIGAKTAMRIILELRDKIAKEISIPDLDSVSINPTVPTSKAGQKNLSEATEALTVLGYDRNSIVTALKDIDMNADVGEIIRMALKKRSR